MRKANQRGQNREAERTCLGFVVVCALSFLLLNGRRSRRIESDGLQSIEIATRSYLGPSQKHCCLPVSICVCTCKQRWSLRILLLLLLLLLSKNVCNKMVMMIMYSDDDDYVHTYIDLICMYV